MSVLREGFLFLCDNLNAIANELPSGRNPTLEYLERFTLTKRRRLRVNEMLLRPFDEIVIPPP